MTISERKKWEKKKKVTLANRIVKSRTSLLRFTKYTKPDYEVKWFHKMVCAYLDKLYYGEIKKLMIFIPPQHGKSELSSRRFPASALGRDPSLKIAVGSYSQDLSSSFGSDVQKIIDTPEYAQVFPNTFLNGPGVAGATEKRTDTFFETVGHGGFMKSVGVTSGLTGKSIDIGIIDDPFKDRSQANSPTYREKVWNWYQDVFLTRLHNDSKQLMLFTRWHNDDLAGRLLDPKNKHYDPEEASEWTVIALPALKEETKPIAQAKNIKDPRQIDEALWEEKHSAKKYYKARRVNPTKFNSLCQQRPSAAEGNKIKREWWVIKKESELPFAINSVAWDFFIDGAFTKESENDETGLGSFYFNRSDGNLYVRNISGVRKELYELLKYFKHYAVNNGYMKRSMVNIELKASGHGIKSMLSKPEHGNFNTARIDNKVVSAGKLNRVENAEPFIAGGKVILIQGPWNERFIDQCAGFPNDVHDDMVDVVSYAIDHYLIDEETGGASYEE